MFTFTCFRCRNGETGMGVISDTRSSRDESLLKKYSLHSQCTRLSAWTLLVSEMKKPGKFQVGKRKFWGIMSGPAQPLMLTLKGHFFFYAFFTQHCISITVPSHILYSPESCDILLKQKTPTQKYVQQNRNKSARLRPCRARLSYGNRGNWWLAIRDELGRWSVWSLWRCWSCHSDEGWPGWPVLRGSLAAWAYNVRPVHCHWGWRDVP